jgi:hypothetical protein
MRLVISHIFIETTDPPENVCPDHETAFGNPFHHPFPVVSGTDFQTVKIVDGSLPEMIHDLSIVSIPLPQLPVEPGYAISDGMFLVPVVPIIRFPVPVPDESSNQSDGIVMKQPFRDVVHLGRDHFHVRIDEPDQFPQIVSHQDPVPVSRRTEIAIRFDDVHIRKAFRKSYALVGRTVVEYINAREFHPAQLGEQYFQPLTAIETRNRHGDAHRHLRSAIFPFSSS